MRDRFLIRYTLLAQKIIVHAILVVLVIVVKILPQFIQQKNKLLLVDGPLDDHIGQRRRWFDYSFLFRSHEKETVEVGQRGAVADQAAVDHKLDVLAESHCVGFGFGEVGPLLVEAGLVALL
jgi:hypothetical protein